ncbi:MAG TPA: flagellar hook-associated protein FlgK [candidate division Zixibacteria bacterium]|nr:flagellar hook-associated protein FlgK [candidate division Zixibacteria bacterium]
MGLFQTLETGKRALLTHQLSLTTIGQNIANVDTPGYTRQRVDISASDPLKTTLGMIGTGVRVNDVSHVRDIFLGAQFRQESKKLGRWNYQEKILSQIEVMFNEPGDDTLRAHLEGFFNAWSQLANAPESTTSRNDIVAKAVTLTNDFGQLSEQLHALKDSVDSDLQVRVEEVNQLSAEIAALNREIVRHEVGGARANDLRDRRDLLIDQMSAYVDVNVIEENDGSARVMIGGMSVVDGHRQLKLETVVENTITGQRSSLVYAGSDVEVKNLNGELRGLVEMRDDVIPRYLAQLDELARTLAREVNNLHAPGYGLQTGGSVTSPTGELFFDVSSVSAQTIKVSERILNDVSLIAASASGEPGDASVALQMSQLRSLKTMAGGSLTFHEFYGSLVGGVGVEAKQAKQFKVNQELVVQQVDNAREQVQGVSLDEEMTHLIRAQHAYDAAARVITTIDQAFETVIHGMGIVGR